MNKFALATVAGVGVLLAALGVAWGTGVLGGDGPSQETWAAAVCTASASHPTEGGSWEELRDRHDGALLLLGLTEVPGGAGEFHDSLASNMRGVATQLRGFARSDPGGNLDSLLADLQQVAETQPRGPSADAAIATLLSTIGRSEAEIRSASDSLGEQSRLAIEGVPGCGARLLA